MSPSNNRVDWKQVAGNAAVAFLAQSFAMLLSAVQTLVVPKFLGVEQFGYWQLFVFYASYSKLFSFGINDGVYLIYGGRTRSTIDRGSISAQLQFSLLYEALVALFVVGYAVVIEPSQTRSFVLLCVAVFLVIQNVCLYITGVLQAINETKKSSVFTIVERLTYLLFLIALFLTNTQDFMPYVVLNLVSNGVGLVYCLWNFKPLLCRCELALADVITDSLKSIRVGIKLTIANLASTLIVGISRFAIDAAWGITVFSKVSLSLSLTTFFLAFVNQASMVLFPALRRSDEGEINRFYTTARNLMEIISPFVYLLYFPLVAILSSWLPEYRDSLAFFMYLIPICVYDSEVNIACFTYLKVQRLENTMLIVNLVTALFSAAGSAVAILVFDSVYLVFAAMVIAIIVRGIFLDNYISRAADIPSANRLRLSELVVTTVFVWSGTYLSPPIAALATAAVCLAHYLYCRVIAPDALGFLQRHR